MTAPLKFLETSGPPPVCRQCGQLVYGVPASAEPHFRVFCSEAHMLAQQRPEEDRSHAYKYAGPAR